MAGYTLGLEGPLYDYYLSHAFREPSVLQELRRETAKLGDSAAMQIGPEQGAFMAMLVKLMGARRILEIGTFTGYSALAMALAGAEHIVCGDVNAEWTSLGQRFWARAGVLDRIELHLDGGTETIKRLLQQKAEGSFDLIFIDADKLNYDTYYEGGLQLVRRGGLIMVDNVLWGGEVADPSIEAEDTVALRALNAKIVGDTRVEISMVPICDGLTLARKL
jgi:predicted O-methyltransferase YrrM